MKALQLTRDDPSKPPTLTLATVPIPQPKNPSDLLIRVKAALILPSDKLNRAGSFPATTYPRIVGRDFAGTVVSGGSGSLVGKDVLGTSGDTLSFTVDGTHAEYVVISEDGVALKPANISFVQAAALGTSWTTAKLALDRAGLMQGDSVLVLGATGSVGSAAVQLSKGMGFRTISAVRGAGRADVDTAGDPSLEGVRKLTSGTGADVVVDAVGSDALMVAALGQLAVKGRYAVFSAQGMAGGKCAVDMMSLYRKQQTIVGCASNAQSIAAMGKSCREIAALIESGKAVPDGEAGFQVIGLQEAFEVYEGTKEQRGAKWMITP